MPAAFRQPSAVYQGVFDPVHRGHLDIIGRGSRIFDRLVVGVGINPDKLSFFTIEERVQLLKRLVSPYPNVEVMPFSNLAVHFVREVGARIMLRGLRTLSDMEYEFTMSLTNLALDPFFTTALKKAQDGWRRTCALGATIGIPTPTFSNALGFYDSYRSARLPANLLQAQRDYFGAHTYERVDKPRKEFFHTNWTGQGGNVSSSTYNV